MKLDGKAPVYEHPLARHPKVDLVRVRPKGGGGTCIAGMVTDFGDLDTIEGHQDFMPGDMILTEDPPTRAWVVRKVDFELGWTTA